MQWRGTSTFSFTTGANFQTMGLTLPAVTATTASGAVSMPAGGTLPNVLDSPTFTISFDHALDPIAVLRQAIRIRDAHGDIAAGVTYGYVISSDQKTVAVRPSGLAAGATYCLSLEAGPVRLFDISGNQPTGYVSQTYFFTTQ